MPITLTLRKPTKRSSTLGTLLVVPTKRRIRHLMREMIAGTNCTAKEPLIYTLELLATRIAQGVFENIRLTEEPVIALLFNQAMASSETGFQYFKPSKKGWRFPQGTFDRIVHVIRKLKEVGVYPEMLEEEIRLGEVEEQPKLRDIAAIYATYEKSLAELNAVDAEGVFKLVHLHCSQKRFGDTFQVLFPEVQEVSIVGFDEFTEPEIGFLQKLCGLPIAISLAFDFQPGNSALFGHLEGNYQRFVELGFAPINDAQQSLISRSDQDSKVQATINHIASHLFKRTRSAQKKNCTGHVTVIQTKDRLSEVEAICKLIKHLTMQSPLRDLSKICVALYKPQEYTAIIREQFKKFGIPANVTDRYELSQSPIVVSIIGLLQVAARHFHRNDVLRSLCSVYFDFQRVDRSNIENVSLDLKILAGMHSWQEKIERRIAITEQGQRSSDDQEETSRRARDVNRLKKAKSDIQFLEALLCDIAQEQVPRDFEKSLHLLLEKLNVARRIVSYNEIESVERDARGYAKLLDVVKNITMLLEYQEGKTKTHSLQFYIEQMKVAIAQERYNVREQFGAGVLVTSIDETRGLPMKVMILAGLVDGEFPSNYQSEIFFSARRLKEREQRHAWENRYLFYQAITNWSEHLYLTYPEQDADLDLVRSSFVDELKNVLDVEEWEYPEIAPFKGALYSNEEYLRYHGSLVGKGRKDNRPVPEHLERAAKFVEHAVHVEESRVEFNTFPEYQGSIFSAISKEAAEQLQQLRHRVYSISQLETYGKCPFQFFAQRLLRLKGIEDFEEEFSPLEKGSVIHDILFEFYIERREKMLPSLFNCSEEEFADAHERLHTIAEQRLAAIDIPDTFWDLEKELILGDKNTGNGILREFLLFERARSTSFQPMYFEVGFGSALGSQTRTDASFSFEEPIVAGNVQLRGKIDRVEISDEAFAIVDYKTGSAIAKLEDMYEGISLQLPLYLYTIEKLLAEKRGYIIQPAAGLYYQLRNKVELKTGAGSMHFKDRLGIRSKAGFLPTDAELRRLMENSVLQANNYVDEITRGNFPLTTRDKIGKVCAYCDFKTICRIQTVRRIEKPKQETS